MAKALPPVSEAVAYAAATYAVAKGKQISKALFAYRSEAQVMIAGAVYLSTKGLSFRKAALAAFCHDSKKHTDSVDKAFRKFQDSGLLSCGLFGAMCLAAREHKLIRVEKPEPAKAERQALGTGLAKLVAQHIVTPIVAQYAALTPSPVIPAEVGINPALSRQTWKPQTDLDKEIYGRPLNARHAIARGQSVSVPMPGDKPEGWVPPVPAADDDEGDAETISVKNAESNRMGLVSGQKKKITLPRIRALEKDMPNG